MSEKSIKKEDKNWFKILYQRYLDVLKNKKPPQAKDGDQGIRVAANILELFPKFNVKKVFFQELEGAFHMYFVLDSNDCFELPVHPSCPITLLTNKGIMDDLDEIKSKKVKNLENVKNQIDTLKEELRDGVD